MIMMARIPKKSAGIVKLCLAPNFIHASPPAPDAAAMAISLATKAPKASPIRLRRRVRMQDDATGRLRTDKQTTLAGTRRARCGA